MPRSCLVNGRCLHRPSRRLQQSRGWIRPRGSEGTAGGWCDRGTETTGIEPVEERTEGNRGILRVEEGVGRPLLVRAGRAGPDARGLAVSGARPVCRFFH